VHFNLALLLAYLHFHLSNVYLIVEVLDYSVLPCLSLINLLLSTRCTYVDRRAICIKSLSSIVNLNDKKILHSKIASDVTVSAYMLTYIYMCSVYL